MSIPEVMKCIKISKFGGPETLKIVIEPVPNISSNDFN